MKRILFVDDDHKVLDGLRRLFHSLRPEWQMTFANSGLEALDVLARDPFDVVVTDIRMPGMDGTDLLAAVRRYHPHIVRIILSGQADRDLTLRSAGTAHQYLSKPCDAETLTSTISRASALKDMFTEPSLKALIASARPLPSVPSLYVELVRQLESPDNSITDIARIISRDTAMTAKILQLANSAFFGIRRRIVDPKDAVIYLGFETVKALTLCVKVFAQFSASACSGFSVDALAKHGVLTGILARKIAKAAGASSREIEDSFMAGLLHDVGKLVLVDALPGEYQEAMDLAEATGMPLWKAEHAVFLTTHAEVGTYLLWLWGLPGPVIESIAYHHSPSSCPVPQQITLAALYVANVLSHAVDQCPYRSMTPDVDRHYVELLGLSEKITAWRTLVEEAVEERETV